MRRSFSQGSEEREAAWPAGWRLPVAGEIIHLAKDYGGFIEQVDWDLGNGAMRLLIR